MFVLRLFPVALVVFWSAVSVSCTGRPHACTKPAIRREWRAFSIQEKAEWIRAVNCLSHLPHDPDLSPSVFDHPKSLIPSWIPSLNSSGSYYDDLVYVHMDLNIRIHWTGLFLPWHRWYVHVFEGSLKDKCGYTGVSPYWNWTIDAPDFYESSFWKDSDPKSGLGGWGDPNADYGVPDGGFSGLHLSYPSPHTLRRNFTLRPYDVQSPVFPDPTLEANASFSAAAIETVLAAPAGDFKGFQVALETFQGAHSSVHEIMGGDLAGACPQNAPVNCTAGPTWSPNEPLFFLHHAMIDKIWFDWQHSDPANANANSFYGGSVQVLQSLEAWEQYPNGGPPFLGLNSTMPTDGMFPEVTIGDVMNTTGGYLCYVYQ